MSGQGNRDITGLRFNLGSLVAFAWRPEGFWVFQNDGEDPFKPRQDRLINRFAQNNYPDREGMAEELLADARLEEDNRIATKDHLIKTWPPYERPVPPMFGIAANETNQDPKDHEGKFSGKKITGKLKLKKPNDFSSLESAYPEEVKGDWYLHAPEHRVYAPGEEEFVENRLYRWIQHYILEYSNVLRPQAPFLHPLRGEYSPAQWIAEFCQKAGELNHESSVYPEQYRSVEERIYKTRQLECSNGFDWWAGENLYFNSNIQTTNSSIEDSAKIIAEFVVNAWIHSPPHYANLIKWREAKYKDLAMLDVGRAGHYYSQVFMGAPWWLQCGFCRWEGLESWQVLSWKTYENNRYREPFEERVYFKGNMLYERSGLIGAAFTQSEEQCYLLVFVLTSKKIQVFEAPFNPSASKDLKNDDFTEVCQHTITEGDYYKKQSFFASRDGEKGITLVNWSKPGKANKQYVVRYENRLLSVSDAELYSDSDGTYAINLGDFWGYDNVGDPAYILISTLQIKTGSSIDISCVDYSDIEILVTMHGSFYSYRNDINNVRSDWWYTIDHTYYLNGVLMQGTGYSIHGVYTHTAWGPIDFGPQFDVTTTGSAVKEFVDLRRNVYIAENTLFIDGQANTLPFNNLYTRQEIDGPGIYPILPNLANNYDYYYKHLLGCTFTSYENEWIFSAIGYQIDFKISEEYELAMEVTSSTPVEYFISSNNNITALLNTLEKPFLVSKV